ncbi:hypothetical protein [Dactylosporangium sp. NPDC005555]
MPWVRGHYARPPRGRRGPVGAGAIIAIAVVIFVVIYLLTR